MGDSKTSRTSRHKVRWPSEKTPASRPAADPAKPTDQAKGGGGTAAGRVVHDERGNAVWRWTKDGGRGGDSTSLVLKRLDAPDLKVEGQEEGTAASPPANPTFTPVADSGGGYNPYDRPKPLKKPAPPKGTPDRRKR